MCSSVRVLPDCSKLSVVTVEPPAPVSALLSHEYHWTQMMNLLIHIDDVIINQQPPVPLTLNIPSSAIRNNYFLIWKLKTK